jgi:hypothetical protein
MDELQILVEKRMPPYGIVHVSASQAGYGMKATEEQPAAEDKQ